VITIHGGGLTPWKPYAPYRWCFEKAFELIGISQRICIEYIGRTSREVRYVPPLFPFRRSDKERGEVLEGYGIPRDSRVVLYVGSLKELKSPGTLIEAFDELRDEFIEGENLYLVMAGDGPLRGELEGAATHRDRTVFLGNVPREEIPDLYGIADLYVITSRFEGTPLSVLEAIYNRVPVIGADSQGINAIIENERNGMLFEFGNHRKLAACMRTMLTDTELRARYVDEALVTYKSRYSYEEVLNAYRRVFSEAAADA
jgi:glycosyltransferase involved in cell wall biosynthesis